MNIIIYDNIGRILRTVSCPDFLAEAQCRAGEVYLEGQANDATQYILNGAVTDRPTMQARLSAKTISGVPAGAVIAIDGQTVGTADGTPIELSFDLPGDYAVTAELFPYITWEVTVHED